MPFESPKSVKIHFQPLLCPGPLAGFGGLGGGGMGKGEEKREWGMVRLGVKFAS